jgi:dimethylhistidine N-methyltransferase
MAIHRHSTGNIITNKFHIQASSFAEDVRKGLTAFPKHLSSKYFYNEKGNELFQKIMHSPEYYLTDCEKEIFETQSGKIIDSLLNYLSKFDIVELGPGDCYKSIHLLKALQCRQLSFAFYPVDISADVIHQLDQKLPDQLPDIKINGLTGDYIEMLKKVNQLSNKNKLILFLGSSIGNMAPGVDEKFFNALRDQMQKNDLLLTGFDLQKNPKIILAAYNDKQGYTRAFNLNLLERINEELHANFNPDLFDHYPVYDPETGTCKSYLISLQRQEVYIEKLSLKVLFDENEYILMERSQKYTLSQIDSFASQTNFESIRHFMDSRCWFTDALWKAD